MGNGLCAQTPGCPGSNLSMPKFRFLEDIAARGVAFEAFGRTERQLLENSALALEEAMIDTKTLRRREKEVVQIRSVNLEDLLFRFLEHLIFLKDAKRLLFREAKLGIERQGKSFVLQGFLYGERLDMQRLKMRADIKSLEKSLFEVGKVKNGFRAQVVLGQ